ncbi:MAG TPA: dihydrodipicolinate synthase family protein [Acidimicrobiales bacterium]
MTGEPSAGVYAVSITPFARDGALDEDGLRAHLRRLGDAGVGVYVGGGGSGEGYTLSPAEHRRVAEVAVDELRGRVPVRAMGVEPRTAAEMVAYVEAMAAAGVDAVQIYSLDVGHGHRPSPAAVEAYLTEVLERTAVPAVVSTHQSVGYNVPVPLLARLAERFDVLAGVNCSHQDLGYLAELIDAVGGRLEVHVGGPYQALAAYALGADGFLSSEANLAPRLAASVAVARRAGDGAALLDAAGRLVRLAMLLYGHGGILATKAVLGRFGRPGGFPRKPHLPLADDVAAELAAEVAGLGVPEIEGWNETA